MRGDSNPPPPPPSARVKLEIAFLEDSNQRTAAPEVQGEQTRLTVFVVAAEADVRRYVAECLRSVPKLRLVDVPDVSSAAAAAKQAQPDLLIVDESELALLERLPRIRAIVIVDEVSYAASTATPLVRLLGRPFSAEELTIAVDALLRLSS